MGSCKGMHEIKAYLGFGDIEGGKKGGAQQTTPRDEKATLVTTRV